MSADAKALRLFGVARDSVEVSAAGQPEPEPQPQPQQPPSLAQCACMMCTLPLLLIGLIVFAVLARG